MEPISAVTGQNITVHCPVYGYPITSIKWWKGSVHLLIQYIACCNNLELSQLIIHFKFLAL